MVACLKFYLEYLTLKPYELDPLDSETETDLAFFIREFYALFFLQEACFRICPPLFYEFPIVFTNILCSSKRYCDLLRVIEFINYFMLICACLFLTTVGNLLVQM